MLLDNNSRVIMQGSSSMDPIATALEAEAYALREAVQQLKKHGYDEVTFYGDSRLTFDTLNKLFKGEKGAAQAIITYCKDIVSMISQGNQRFKFHVILRSANLRSDVLAKQARIRCANLCYNLDVRYPKCFVVL